MKTILLTLCSVMLLHALNAQMLLGMRPGSSTNSMLILVKSPAPIGTGNFNINSMKFTIGVARTNSSVVFPTVSTVINSASIFSGTNNVLVTPVAMNSVCAPFQTYTIEITGPVAVSSWTPDTEYEVIEVFFSGNSEAFRPVLLTVTPDPPYCPGWSADFNTDPFNQSYTGSNGPFFMSSWAVSNNVGYISSVTNSNTIHSSGINIPASTLLPVDFKSLHTRVDNNCQLYLQWTSYSELASDYYDIESSTDGIFFSNLRRVNAAAATDGSSQYDVLVAAPAGTKYLRLKTAGGTYSQTVSTMNSRCQPGVEKKSSIYPNPLRADKNIMLTYSSATGGQITAELFTTAGSLVQKQIFRTQPGENNFTLSAHAVKPGLYIFKLTEKDGTVTSNKIAITQ